LRSEYMEEFLPILNEILVEFLEVENLTVAYNRGWSEEKELGEVLQSSFARDSGTGNTNYGPHHADIQIKVNNIPAQNILSRGQQKLFVCALYLAQGIYLSEHTDKHCVYLIDDLPAELDENRRERVYRLLQKVGAQVFMTCIDKNALKMIVENEGTKVFSIKDGIINEE